MPNQSAFDEQLKSAENLNVGWPWRIFTLTLIVFLFSIFIYLGISFGLNPYLDSRIAELNQKISALNQSVDETQQKQLMNFYSRLVNMKDLLNSKGNTLAIFDFIEKNTYSNVHYTNLTANIVDKEIKIDGSAPDYDTMIKEMTIFENSPLVEKITLENLSSIEAAKNIKEIKFALKMNLRPEIFK